MTIGEKIKYYRNLNGLSQINIAQKLGIFYTAVGKWEKDAYVPSIVYIMKMCKIFNITIDEFVEDVEF